MFQAVENVYEGEQVIKYECIGHYQKSRKLFAKTLFMYKRPWW